ncbi:MULTISPECIES: pilin [Candidatus Ichthyocystis]|uniref:Putative membrane protein n=1 Tax=Candidatus Ichthyocystis hellenicum TaxID=1561003 RepID=A0A0S4M469_9BURK|nr:MULTISPECIES: pilin [Ichthyocystis]CUT16952.1 putative membrane protein [Candidatus Ichthyocystis hellenicum]
MISGLKLTWGISKVEVVAVIVIILGCWFIFSPIYQRHLVIRDFQSAINELSFLKAKTSKFVSNHASCPDEIGNSFPGSRLISAYSLVVAPVGFSHGCLIRARFGSLSHKLLRSHFIELSGAQTSGGLLTWSCNTTFDGLFLPVECGRVPLIAFP